MNNLFVSHLRDELLEKIKRLSLEIIRLQIENQKLLAQLMNCEQTKDE